ncbi:unnamed protein product [Victoria cruziana]
MADNGSDEKRAAEEDGPEEKKGNDGDRFREKTGSGARERDSEEKGKKMTPWEQHASIISIPRFDYEAPAAILEHSHCGFLITCTISNPLDENSVNASTRSSAEDIFPLSLVKLTRSGLLLFTIPRHLHIQNVNILTHILGSLDSEDEKLPVWCHRILPFQATCILREKDLAMAVSRLVDLHMGNEDHVTERPLKFAVAFNRRGVEETEMKQKGSVHDCHESPLLDKNECLRVVASAVKDTVPDSVVDLKSPQMAVLIEVLPISGIPPSSLVVALAVLPHSVVNTKPRLNVKALSADPKGMKRRS